MELLLKNMDLWEHIEGDPPDVLPSTWASREVKAKALIGLHVEDDQLIHIRRKTTAKEMWTALREYHQKSTLSTKVRLLRRLCRTTMPEGGDMQSHINVMDGVMDELTTLGEPIKEQLAVAFYLSSLPESYGPLITALESRPEEDLTNTIVKSKLIEEYNRRKEIAGSSEYSGENALKVNGDKHSNFSNTKGVCNFCKKVGHFKAECRKFASWKKNKEAKTGNQANAAKHNVLTDDDDEQVCLMVLKQDFSSEIQFCVDSGASAHMCCDEKCFTRIVDSSKSSVTLADGRSVPIRGVGTVRFKTKSRVIHLEDVLFVPDLNCNLISVSKLTKKGCKVIFEEQQCHVYLNGQRLLSVKSVNDVYKAIPQHQAYKSAYNETKCVHEWHRVLGHRNLADVRRMAQLADNVCISDCEHSDVCEFCLQSKSTRDPFPKKATKKTKDMLDLVHTDLCGPFQVATPRGNRYMLTIIDDHTRYSHVYLIAHKSDTASRMIEFVQLMKTQYGKVLKAVRSDRGGEYMDNDLRKYFRENGMVTQLTVPKTPQQNGVAERKNRTLVEMTRCMLASSGLHKQYWGEAISTANHILNRLPRKEMPTTPYEQWHGRKPNFTYLQEFGTLVYAHIPKDQRKKLDNTSEKLVFVGYELGSKGYRLLDVKTHKIKINRDVKQFPANNDGHTIVTQFDSPSQPVEEDELEGIQPEGEQQAIRSEGEDAVQLPQTLRRSSRSNKGIPPVRFIDEMNARNVEETNKDPVSYEEAINGPDSTQWKRAMDEEMESLRIMGTWEMAKLPPESNVIGSKWVFKTKTDQDGNIIKYKARLVAQGFSQKYGRDYDEVFAPVANPTTLKILLAVAARRNMDVRHFDIQTAYLNGDLSHDVYMRQPKGYFTGNKDEVCKLVKNLYGLKQGAKEWNRKFDEVMKRNGYSQSDNDACLYTKIDNGDIVYISNHVDDIVAAATTVALLEKFEKEMNNEFIIKNLGCLQYYLGIQFERDQEGVFYMHQEKYIMSKLQQFNMTEARDSSTPIGMGYKSENGQEIFESTEVYRSAIGSLLYLSTNTRPDIAVATSILARKVSSPTDCDWLEVKRVFRYLKSTKDLKLKLGNGMNDGDLICYVDSDHAGDEKDRRSTSGYCFIFNGALIGWASRKQSTVSLSTTQSEFVAFAEAAREIIWIEMLLQDFGQTVKRPIRVYEDNQGCIAQLQDAKGNQRIKHVDVRYKYSRELIASKQLEAIYCETSKMIADMLTKPLNGPRLAKFAKDVGLTN